MTKTIYALLVAVDNYHPGTVSNLRGCKRDVHAFHQYLEGRLAAETYKPLLLTDAAATRQGVIDGFRSHLAQAQSGDHAIFYFSGHGSYAPTPEELWHLEPDHRDETLVCHDSRTVHSHDLADKELSFLIYEVAERGAQVTVILDCCHSGSGTRTDEVGIRQAKGDERERTAVSYLFMQNNRQAYPELAELAVAEDGRLHLPEGKHVSLAACKPEQYAKEVLLDGQPGGVFSYFLLESLKMAGNSLSYRDLYMRVNALVQATVSEQVPQLEARKGANLERPFLGGAIQPTPKHFTVSYDKALGWVVDAGQIHGITSPRQDETTHFALFPFDATPDMLTNLEGSRGVVAVTNVFGTRSQVRSDDKLNEQTTYKAVVISLPINPLLVKLSGHEVGVQQVRQALATYGLDGGPSVLVQEAQAGGSPTLVLEAMADRYLIRRWGDNEPLAVSTEGLDEAAAKTAVGQLEHIARWHNLLHLHHPASSLNPNAIKLRFEVRDENNQWVLVDTTHDIRLSYCFNKQDRMWHQPEFRLSLENVGKQPVFCMLFNLSETFAVDALTENDGQWLDSGELYQFGGDTFWGKVPDNLWAQGRTTTQDTLKLIVTTEASYARRLEQPPLPVHVPETRTVPANLPQPDTLTRLMQRINTREVERSRSQKVSAWSAQALVFTTERPAAAKIVG